MTNFDLHFFPGWVRKSFTFSIDDGNIEMDEKFLHFTKPAGVKGTFNLCTPLKEGFDYKSFYEGYEIADHCYRHAYPLTEKTRRPMKDEPFDRHTADTAFAYMDPEEDGLARFFTYKWVYLAPTTETYLACARRAQKELEEVFGKGSVRSYVWPYGYQENDEVNAAIRNEGYQSVRITGRVKDKTGFAFPADRQAWSYNADHNNLLDLAKTYAEYPDDGELKFFCFGLHSYDYENNDCWNVLEDFCRDYGNRPDRFYYASVGDLFDYEDAVKSVIVTENSLKNPSNVDLYIKLNGEKTILPANGEIKR